MIPLPVYIAQLQPNLLAGYSEFQFAIAMHIGSGIDSSDWTTDQIAEMDRDIQEAYRWCLYPQSIPGEKVPHVWSFMEQTTTLVTVSGDYDYTLPADFGSFVGRYMIWPEGEGYDPPYRTNDSEILMLRQHRTTTGRPQCFSLRWVAQTAGLNQRQELIFWPTPDSAYTLTYRYAILTGKLSMTNPYPLGGPRIAQLMIEACKAIGETKRNGQRGDQWTMFMAELQSAIQLDKGTNTTPTLGVMRGDDNYARCLQQKRPTTNYYYGPGLGANNLVDGLYTLEV